MVPPPTAIDPIQAHGSAGIGRMHEAPLADIDADMADLAAFANFHTAK